jgi:Domain of unknown function (DUF4411)
VKKRYWVDANVFIWGNREPYPLPGYRPYWDSFESRIDAGRIVTHWTAFEEVVTGLKKGDPEIVLWVKTRRAKLVAPPDTKECQKLVGEVCKYAIDSFGFQKANDFVAGADAFLIACASLDEGTVVTQECTKKQVRIPRVCKHFGVQYTDLFKMNKALGISPKSR